MQPEVAHTSDGGTLTWSAANKPVELADTACAVEHQSQSQLRCRENHRLRCIGDDDAVGARIVNIDIVESDPEVRNKA